MPKQTLKDVVTAYKTDYDVAKMSEQEGMYVVASLVGNNISVYVISSPAKTIEDLDLSTVFAEDIVHNTTIEKNGSTPKIKLAKTAASKFLKPRTKRIPLSKRLKKAILGSS